MKKTFIIFAKDSPVITFKVKTDDSYIVDVEDLTGLGGNFEKLERIEEFDERYFQIKPWYWFEGFETK